jgi:hypothetical protein
MKKPVTHASSNKIRNWLKRLLEEAQADVDKKWLRINTLRNL